MRGCRHLICINQSIDRENIKKEMKRFIYNALLLLAVFIAMGCSSGENTATRKSKEEIAAERKKDSLALKVGVGQTINCLPAFVAQDEGIFDSLGVDVRLRHYTSMLDCDVSLRRHTIEGAFTDVKRMDYLNSHYKNLLLKSVMPTDMQWQLVANRLSRLHEPKQFTDKMVAMTRFSATDFLCDRMVDSVKLNKERVFRIQVNDVDLRLNMLLNNEIDAAWLPEPQASVAKRKGHNVLMQSGRGGEKLAVLAFTDKAMTDSRRKEQIDLFVKAYGIAQERINKGGRSYYRQLVKKYFNYQIN